MNIFKKIAIGAVFCMSAITTRAQIVIMPSMFGVQHAGSTPPSVQTQSITMDDDGTAITAAVNITAPAGTTVSTRGVCYSTSPNPTTSNTTTTNGSGTGTYSGSLNISGATIYYVRGYAVIGGSTLYGNELRVEAFAYSAGVQTFTVPAGVTSATIKVLGAAGGDSYLNGVSAYGGKGASIRGTFTVTAGESIYVLVGQKGQDGNPSVSFRGSGGGGGTFVYRSVSGNPMIIAGGGGGGLYNNTVGAVLGHAGQSGTSGSSGTAVTSDAIGPGGANGNGGNGKHAGGGAGWLTAGSSDMYPALAGQRNPWNGGANYSSNPYGKGGYGGGGSAFPGTGGGGGGYSGGSACAMVSMQTNGSGGGGGSYNAGGQSLNSTGGNSGDGLALITW